MWDLWENDPTFPATYRIGLRKIKDNPDLQPMVRAATADMVRGEFEKTTDFEQRKQQADASLQQLLSKPVLLPATRDTGRHPTGFAYDADRELIQGLLQIKHTNDRHVVLVQAYRELMLRTPDADVVRAVTSRVKNPVDVAAILDGLDYACPFPLPVADAQARMKNLSVLYNVRVQSSGTTKIADEAVGTLPDRNLPGVLPDRVVRVSTSRGVVVLDIIGSQIDVWLVDRVKRQRLGMLPLNKCSLSPQ